MSEAAGPAPLRDLRIVELTSGRAGRTAARLLADLGADVIRVVDEAPRSERPDPESLSCDRGKRLAAIGNPPPTPALEALLAGADVFVTDLGPTACARAGVTTAALAHRHPELVAVWLSPYGRAGEAADLPPDPLLLSAAGGFAGLFPSADPAPVAPVTPAPVYVQAALGAAAAVAGVIGRDRGRGALGVEVSGLHASGALLTPMLVEALDEPVVHAGRTPGVMPAFRLYRGRDGRWFFLAALSQGLFFRALDVVGRMDVLAMPGVDGDFVNLLRPDAGRAVGAVLQQEFDHADTAEWVARFRAAGIPAAPVQGRESWLDSEMVAACDGRTVDEHPQFGPVAQPAVPIAFDGRVPVSGVPAGSVTGSVPAWHSSERWGPADRAATTAGLPLDGLRVIDASTYFAAPFAAAVLAEHGADVIKVEPPEGDPYRPYSVPHMIVNKRKHVIAVDLHGAEGRRVFDDLLRDADVVLDNLRPSRRGELGLDQDDLAQRHPRLVHCSLTAFGESGDFADLPGFDPVLQSLSGIARAQGGETEPRPSNSAVNDITGGALAALAALTSLAVRMRSGRPARVTTSLTMAASFLQSVELVQVAGREPPETGGADHRGPHAGRRLYRTADGWIAIAATHADPAGAVVAALGAGAPTGWPDDVTAVSAALEPLTTREALAALTGAGIPACRVLTAEKPLDDPLLVANEFDEIVEHPAFGRVRAVRSYCYRPGFDPPASRHGSFVGRDTRSVLRALGYDDDRIESLIESGTVVAGADSR